MNTHLMKLYNFTMVLTSNVSDIDQAAIEELILLRDEVIEELKAQEKLTQEEKDRIQDINKFNETLISQMVVLRDEASQALDKINRYKLQRNIYEQRYSGDSYFIDKKK